MAFSGLGFRVQGLGILWFSGSGCRDPTSASFRKPGFGVPYFNTFFLKGTLMKQKFLLFSPWLLKSPEKIPTESWSSLGNHQKGHSFLCRAPQIT